MGVKAVFIILMLSITFLVQAGERLEGISGSMNNNTFLGWFGDKDEETEQENPAAIRMEGTDLLASENRTQLAGDTCAKEKVYTLDVENADQYERLEDFPFTYECVRQR